MPAGRLALEPSEVGQVCKVTTGPLLDLRPSPPWKMGDSGLAASCPLL